MADVLRPLFSVLWGNARGAAAAAHARHVCGKGRPYDAVVAVLREVDVQRRRPSVKQFPLASAAAVHDVRIMLSRSDKCRLRARRHVTGICVELAAGRQNEVVALRGGGGREEPAHDVGGGAREVR